MSVEADVDVTVGVKVEVTVEATLEATVGVTSSPGTELAEAVISAMAVAIADWREDRRSMLDWG
jgi:hypothetical protein